MVTAIPMITMMMVVMILWENPCPESYDEGDDKLVLGPNWSASDSWEIFTISWYN